MKERRSGPETEKDVPHAVVMGKHTDHNDTARILLIDFRGRNMEFVLQLRCQAFDDHPSFLQAVNPGEARSRKVMVAMFVTAAPESFELKTPPFPGP